MSVGVPRERIFGERRVAQTPKTVGALVQSGVRVVVESGAGDRASFPDSAYGKDPFVSLTVIVELRYLLYPVEAGATICPDEGEARSSCWQQAVILKIHPPSESEAAALCLEGKGRVLCSLVAPRQNEDIVASLAAGGVSCIALDLVPRTLSRAQVNCTLKYGIKLVADESEPMQAFDVLSSQASIAGYRAVIECSHVFGRLLASQMTAAGSSPPAKASDYPFEGIPTT